MVTMNNLVQRIITGVCFAGALAAVYFFLPAIAFSLVLFMILGIILFAEWPKMGIMALTLWYPILPFALLIILNQLQDYHSLVLLIFALAMLFDVGGYVVGSLIGKYKLAPQISPKKTLEGVAGGLIFSLLLAFVPPLSLIGKSHPILVICLILVADFTALAGDLFVSLLKRRTCTKDCGTSLPGHGGLLDRFDSILFVTFVIFAIRKYLI